MRFVAEDRRLQLALRMVRAELRAAGRLPDGCVAWVATLRARGRARRRRARATTRREEGRERTLQIDILAKAIDEATAELKKIQSEVKKTEAVSDESVGDVEGVGGRRGRGQGQERLRQGPRRHRVHPRRRRCRRHSACGLGRGVESAGAHAEAASRIVEGGAKIIAATTKAVTDADQALLSYARTVAALAGDWQTLNALAAEGASSRARRRSAI